MEKKGKEKYLLGKRRGKSDLGGGIIVRILNFSFMENPKKFKIKIKNVEFFFSFFVRWGYGG